MKKTLLIALMGLFLCACGNKAQEYRIHGRVSSNELEGIQVFLVPLGHEEPWNVDSVKIHDHEFAFRGKEHWMCELRLDMHHRDKGQNLLVATEPGDIYVTIGPDSSGGGTPQNDSLQVWKELTVKMNKTDNILRKAGLRHELDSVRNDYKDRTRSMALALGEESIAGEFLLKLYPLPKMAQ